MGIDLAGAKNQKTTLAALEYYPKQNKIFLLDIFDQLGEEKNFTADEAILERIKEFGKETSIIGTSVPLSLPPCITCIKKQCPMPAKCKVPSIKWMRDQFKKAEKSVSKEKHLKRKSFTPYTQRPIELWLRYRIFPKIEERYRFEIDETLGGNRAPLTARMNYLQRHIKKLKLVEISPKLSLGLLSKKHKIPIRLFDSYRDIERGVFSRKQILESLTQKCGIFVYQKDLNILSKNINAFHAFICAYTALLQHEEKCELKPKFFPKDASWISYPKI